LYSSTQTVLNDGNNWNFALWPGNTSDFNTQAGGPLFPSGTPDIYGITPSNSQPPVPGYATTIKTYLCPSDPSAPTNGQVTPSNDGLLIHFSGQPYAACSYAFNAQVFCLCNTNPNITDFTNFLGLDGQPRIPTTFVDGTSNTIIFGEKYAHCQGTLMTNYDNAIGGVGEFSDGGSLWAYDNYDFIPNSGQDWFAPWHPEFAQSLWEGAPGFPVSTIGPGSVFQLLPNFQTECISVLANTGHVGGMVICMGDASVRTLSPSVSGATWWALCTPAGREILGNDW
jgi:hypothetical protein